MESNKPPTPVKVGANSEEKILNFTLQFKEHNFNCELCEIEKKKLKLIAKDAEENNLENEYYKYEKILELNTLKSSHKYFKMFDDYSEFKENFIALCNSKKVGITSFDKDAIKLKIDLALLENNMFIIELKKVEIKGREKDLNNIKIIKNLNLRIEELEKNSKLKDNKILSLEKELNELKLSKEKEIKDIKDEIIQLKNVTSLLKKKCFPDFFEDSDILINNDDKKLISSWVPLKLKKTKLLFNSNIDGDSFGVFLKKSNGKYPTMLIIQTTKGGIFGGYTSKPWKEEKTTDNNAFVFSLYTKKKYSIKDPSRALGLSCLGESYGNFVFGWLNNAIVINENSTSNSNNFVGNETYDIPEKYELNNGERNFTVRSFELFHLKE